MRPVPEFRPAFLPGPVRLLLVEDDGAFAELLRAELDGIDGADITLERADTLAKALALLSGGGFDLVIADLNLPDSRSLETLQRLSQATGQLIIVMTGERDERLRAAALAQGAYDLVDKDHVERHTLERLIRLAMLQSNALRRHRESAEQSRSLATLLASLNAANEVLLRARSAEELLGRACEIAVQANDFALGAVYLHREGSDRLERAAASGPAAQFEEQPPPSIVSEVPEGRGLIGQAYRSRAAVVSNDYANDPATAHRRHAGGYPRSYPVGSAAAFPLLVEGTVAGVFGLQHARPGVFTEELTALIQRLADNIAFALASFRRDDELRRFRLAMDHSADLFVLVDRASMKFVDVNETVQRLLGYTREELLAMGPEDVLPVSREELEAAYDALIAKPSQQDGMKSHYRCKDGSLLPFISTRHALRSGGRWLVAAISRDMRESFAAERALRESEERYRNLVELSSDWYWEQDEQYRFVRMSGRVALHVREARIGRRCWEIETDEPVNGTWDEHRARVERREPYKDLLLRVRRAGGVIGYVSVSGQPVYKNGLFIGYEGSTKDVTDRVRAEEELRASEERFRQLTELSSDWYWEQDEDFRIVKVSAGSDPGVARRLTGKKPWELEGYAPMREHWAEHRARLSRRQPYRDEPFRLLLPDGAYRYFSVSGHPVLQDGRFRGYRGTAREVTVQMRASEALQRFRTALDNSADMILIIDPQAMRYVDANETACRLLGYSREEILARGPHDVLPVPREQIERSYAALIAGSEADGVMNSYYLCKDGSHLPFESTRHKVRAGERWIIAAISRDIRQRMAAEGALRESEERFRALTELSSDVFWEQDAQFRFTSITGLGAERNRPLYDGMAGKRRWELSFFNMTPADWAAHRALLEQRLPFRDLELGTLDSGGEEHWASVSGAPVLDESGALKGYRGVGKDITARKREERLLALEHSAARLLAEAKSVEDALQAVMGAICRSEKWQCARYFELEEPSGAMRLRHAWTDGTAAMAEFVRLSSELLYTRGRGLVGRVWESGEALWAEDATRDPRVAMKGLATAAGVHGALVVPVRFEGVTMGILSISSALVRAPDERLLRTLQLVGDQVGQFVRRKRTEAAVAESEARFRQTFELAASGIAHVALDGRLLRVNRQLCDLLGYSEQELMALSVGELTHPQDRGISEEGIREVRKGTRQSCHFEKRYRRKDGDYVWFSINVAVVRSDTGAPLYEVAVLEDVTERRAKDAALAESEARFRSLTELSSDWYWEQDTEFRFTKLQSQADSELLQIMLGRRRWEGPGADAAQPGWREHIEKLQRHERFRDFEYSYLGADGRRTHVRSSGYPVFDDAGRFQGYRGIARDVTRQRESREQLRRFRTALDASADIILLVDPRDELRLLDFNETACYYLGYARDELLGGRSDRLVADMPAEALQESLEQLLRREDRTDLVLRTYVRKDGSRFEAEVLRRVVDSDEGPIVVVNARDLTERRRAEERQAAHLRYQESTARFGQAALAKRDAGALVAEAVQGAREALGDAVVLYLEPGMDRDQAIVRGTAGAPVPAEGETLSIGAHDAVRQVLDDGEPVLLDGPRAEGLPVFGTDAAFGGGVFVPVHGDGDVRGVLCALSGMPSSLGPEESKFLVATASVLSAGLSRIESEERLAFLAQFDVLTGLPNRALLRDRFSQLIVQARRHGYTLGVLFIDLDDFKMVNDSVGHAGGDDLLRAVASRLLSAVRPGDTVARISGDEFAVILGDLARPDDGALVAQKILDRLSTPLEVRGQEVFVTASIGIAAFPSDGDDAEALLAAADAAMYRAKQSGRNGYQFFTADINQRTRARAQLGSELRRALERSEFEVFYQPKFDLRSGRPCAAEALLRWRHPERGIVSPAEFVPVLEETGLIVPVGEAVLRRACEDLKAWRAAGLPTTPVAVNLSARQFRQQSLDARILELVGQAGVAPELIELEITESQLMQDPEHAARVVRSLSEAGIRVAIDDFGTGYSSLSYLTRFPVSALKIDRSFVADVLNDQADAAIVRAIIDMAHTLGFIVVAEGVETEAQAVLLRSLGCEQAQGYHFARPMPEADYRALIGRGSPPGPARK